MAVFFGRQIIYVIVGLIYIIQASKGFLQLEANREITTHLKTLQHEQFHMDTQHYEIRREIDELEREHDYITHRQNELELIINKYQRALTGNVGNLQFETNLETNIYLDKFKREQSDIRYRSYEIQFNNDKLERKDCYLVDYLNELESIIDKCQRALAGEPIFIWVELQRSKWKLEIIKQQISHLDLD